MGVVAREVEWPVLLRLAAVPIDVGADGADTRIGDEAAVFVAALKLRARDMGADAVCGSGAASTGRRSQVASRMSTDGGKCHQTGDGKE